MIHINSNNRLNFEYALAMMDWSRMVDQQSTGDMFRYLVGDGM